MSKKLDLVMKDGYTRLGLEAPELNKECPHKDPIDEFYKLNDTPEGFHNLVAERKLAMRPEYGFYREFKDSKEMA